MSNDLSRGLFPAEEVKLLVVDEAHRAQGDYAYCQVHFRKIIIDIKFTFYICINISNNLSAGDQRIEKIQHYLSGHCTFRHSWHGSQCGPSRHSEPPHLQNRAEKRRVSGHCALHFPTNH